jgi:hypothetical protein
MENSIPPRASSTDTQSRKLPPEKGSRRDEFISAHRAIGRNPFRVCLINVKAQLFGNQQLAPWGNQSKNPSTLLKNTSQNSTSHISLSKL